MSRIADPRRRDDILEAARHTFQRHGYDDAPMTLIAKRAKIAVGTLYLYFDSKEAIASALAAELFGRAAAVMAPILERPLTRARLSKLVHQVFDVVLSDPTIGAAGLPLADVHPSHAPEAYSAITNTLGAAFERQMKAGTMRQYDPRTFADYFVILLRRGVLVSGSENAGEREPYASTLIDLLAAAMLPLSEER